MCCEMSEEDHSVILRSYEETKLKTDMHGRVPTASKRYKVSKMGDCNIHRLFCVCEKGTSQYVSDGSADWLSVPGVRPHKSRLSGT